MSPIKENLKVMLFWGWSLEQDEARLQANRESMRRRMSKDGVCITVINSQIVMAYYVQRCTCTKPNRIF